LKVEIHNQVRLFRRNIYFSGLYLAEFHILKLTSEGVNATHEELQYFQHLPDWEEAQEFISPIMERDRVCVVSGTFKGGWRRTLEVKMTLVCLNWENNNQDVCKVLT
jgi:hypothetical protein